MHEEITVLDLFSGIGGSKTSSPSASLKSTGPTRPSTTMSEPSTQMDLEELISSQEVFLVSPGVSPGTKEAQKMTAISGQRWLPLLKSYGLNFSLAKTCEALLTSPWASSAAFLTWRGSGTKPCHLSFQLAPSMPRTEETGSGLLPTPVAYDATPGGPNNHYKGLGHQAKHGTPRLLHTPTAKANQMAPSMNSGWWPTPTTPTGGGERSGDRAGTGNLHYMARSGRTVTNSLGDAVRATEASGSLNPTWVEWLMGFPLGWTACDALETQSSRKSLSKSAKRSLKAKNNE